MFNLCTSLECAALIDEILTLDIRSGITDAVDFCYGHTS